MSCPLSSKDSSKFPTEGNLTRPDNPIEYLAKYLLEHNPEKTEVPIKEEKEPIQEKPTA